MNKKLEMENMDGFNINYYENIIQNLQYTNSLIDNKNKSLEMELETIKNKYNLCQQDLNDINMHISICKETQDKIIKDLQERNDYLEKLYESKENNNMKEENINKDNNDNMHKFVEKMKILFDYEGKENINDEDFLNIIENNIIKMNEEFLLCRTELNKKVHEINKLKHEIQNMKLYQNNLEYNIPKGFSRVKTPIGDYKNKLKFLNNNKNQNIQIPNVNNSPKSLKNKMDNYVSIPKTPQLNIQTFNESFKDISVHRSKNKRINIDKKLINSHSLNSNKFKTLKESEKERKYDFQRENSNNNENINTNKDMIQSIMNNLKHLESTFKIKPNITNNN